MKNYILSAAVMLLCILMLPLAACSGGADSGVTQSDSVQLPDETTAVQAAVLLAADMAKYEVIRPDDSNEDLKAAVSALFLNLQNKFGSSISIKTDYYKEGIAAFAMGEYEVLVGNTNRPESRQFLSGLRIDDYGYALINNKLVIAGISDDATVNAVKAFTRDIFNKYDGGDVFYSSESDMKKTGSYAIDELKIGDFSIGEYRIVYPDKSENSEKMVAEGLRGTITDVTGWTLDIVSDKEPADGRKEILVGLTNRDTAAPAGVAEDEAYVGFDGTNIRLWGADITALMAASRDFSEPFRDAVGKSMTLTPEEKKTVKFDNTIMRAMSFNVLVSKMSDERTARVIQMVKNYMPDTVGFQEASPTWMNNLTNGLKDIYDHVGEGRDGGNSGEFNPIYYNKSKFDLLDSGTRWLSDTPEKVSKYSASSLNRIYTYALLQRKADGAKIMVVNTHFEHTSEEARNLQAKVLVPFIKENLSAGMPLILTGDFNTTADKSCYATVISAGVVNAAKAADSAVEGATYHNWGASNKIIDFIFVNPAAMHVQNYKVCSELINGDYCSDHHPVYIEYKVAK